MEDLSKNLIFVINIKYFEVSMKEQLENIINKTTHLFVSKGFYDTSIQDISLAVGLKKASIFHYFDTKESLLECIIRHAIRKEKGWLSKSFNADIISFKKQAFDYYSSDDASLVLISIMGGCLSHIHNNHKMAMQLILNHIESTVELLAEFIDDTKKIGYFNARKIAETIISDLHGTLLMAKVTGSISGLERWASYTDY